jgi:hypothetical protein
LDAALIVGKEPPRDNKMSKISEDKTREERIAMEIIVDAYGPEEQAMGWYCYLDEYLHFPFRGRCIKGGRTSPLKVGEVVTVMKMAHEDYCMHDMFVEIKWAGRKLAVPLSQIEAVGTDDETREAIADWYYWIARGYQLA